MDTADPANRLVRDLSRDLKLTTKARPRVEYFDGCGSDRHVAAFFWESTHDDDAEAFRCPKSDIERIIRFGMKAQPVPHATPWGHSRLTFHAHDVPLAIIMQWLRHRVQNFSQKSLRYVASGPEFYIPRVEDVRQRVGRPGHYTYEPLDTERALRCVTRMLKSYRDSFDNYIELLADGMAEEQARFVLPTGTLSRLYASAGPRDWLNFLVMRNDIHAQAEIRWVAEQIEPQLAERFPITYRIWVEYGRRII